MFYRCPSNFLEVSRMFYGFPSNFLKLSRIFFKCSRDVNGTFWNFEKNRKNFMEYSRIRKFSKIEISRIFILTTEHFFLVSWGYISSNTRAPSLNCRSSSFSHTFSFNFFIYFFDQCLYCKLNLIKFNNLFDI